MQLSLHFRLRWVLLHSWEEDDFVASVNNVAAVAFYTSCLLITVLALLSAEFYIIARGRTWFDSHDRAFDRLEELIFHTFQRGFLLRVVL